MAKNIQEGKENINEIKKPEPPKPEHPHPHPQPHPENKHIFAKFSAFACLIVLLAFLACLSVELHQTKVINNEILPQMRADYAAKIDSLTAEVSLLQREINKMKTDNFHDSSNVESYINTQIEQLKENLPVAGISAEDSELIKINSNKIAALEKTIEALHTQESTSSAELRFMNEIMLASGALTVRGLAENGESFVYETEVLQILAQGNQIAEEYVADIKKYASSGISGKSMLIKSFNSFYAYLGNEISEQKVEETIPADEKWYDTVLRKLKNLVTFRKTDTPALKFDAAPDEVYDSVNEGNLSQALKLIATSPKYMQLHSVVLAEWIKQVEDYIVFEKAANGLIMNSLANIRMKEFQSNNQITE
ncbi:MAG: hypothetical protein IJ564_05425 [Alphaproteobacteria bacterium]|nr:hypothetical protein [Alphaproteobacteria bacterium]